MLANGDLPTWTHMFPLFSHLITYILRACVCLCASLCVGMSFFIVETKSACVNANFVEEIKVSRSDYETPERVSNGNYGWRVANASKPNLWQQMLRTIERAGEHLLWNRFKSLQSNAFVNNINSKYLSEIHGWHYVLLTAFTFYPMLDGSLLFRVPPVLQTNHLQLDCHY